MSDIILHENSFGGNAGLIPVKSHEFPGGTKLGVSAKTLYDFLGLAPTQWTRWAKKNIIKNPYAIENEDYIIFDLQSNITPGRPTDDYAITLDLAKKLSMMARTAKGEDARNYFLECERRAHGQEIPYVSDPGLRMLLEQSKQLQGMIVRLDRAQIEAEQAKVEAAQAQAMALQVAQMQQYQTIREFVMFNDLTKQCPPGTTQQQFGKFMTGYCREHNWPLRKMPTENTFTEWAYPAHLLQQNIFTFLSRRNGQLRIDIHEDGIWHNDN